MKKQILTIVASLGVALSSMAQGSVSGLNNTGLFFSYGANQSNPSTASTYYVGSLSLALYFSTTATSGQISSINALNGTAGGGSAAQALLAAAGFTSVATATGAANSGNQISGFASTINLSSAFAPSAAGSYALVFTGSGGQSAYSSVVSFGGGNYGGNPAGTPPGTPYSLSGNGALTTFANTFNVDLTTSVPEPGTMALAALGGASLLLFRRKK